MFPKVIPYVMLPLTLASMLVSCSGSDSSSSGGDSAVSQTAVLSNYSTLVYTNYQDALVNAEALKTAIDTFVDSPSEANFTAAKEAWLTARDPYGQTEAFRFYDGPIDDEDGPEGQLNAWPLDEVYLDYVASDASAGIINNTDIEITKENIANYNEGGEDDITGIGEGFDPEKAIASGYHAIEFLLWGQDLSATGPGDRSWQDYLSTDAATASNGDRRGTYLKLTAELLVDDLTSLVAEWRSDDADNYRNSTFADYSDDDAIKLLITSIGILAKGELAGERIDVALSTQEQEDEHSCFSDNTYKDIWANAKGIQNVYLGQYDVSSAASEELDSVAGASLSDLIAAANPTIDSEIRELLANVISTTNDLPLTFDQVISSSDSEGIEDLNTIVENLQSVGDKLVEAAADLGLGTISVELPE